MLDTGHELPLRGSVRAQLVSDHDPWRSPLLLDQFSHQPLGCFGIAATLYQHIEDKAVLIDCAPEPACLATNCEDDFIKMSLAIKLTSRSAADVPGILTAELLGPHPDRLVRDDDPAFRQQVFNDRVARVRLWLKLALSRCV